MEGLKFWNRLPSASTETYFPKHSKYFPIYTFCSQVSVASVWKVILSQLIYIHFLFPKWNNWLYHLKCSWRQAATQLARIIKFVGHLSVSTAHSKDLQPSSCLLKSHLSSLLNTDHFEANRNFFFNCLMEEKN